MPKKIGEMIHERRTELGLTLEEVGDSVGVGKSTVRKWECGLIKNMRRDKIALLAKVLQISAAELIGGIDSDPCIPDYAIRIHSVPAVGSIACGKPIEAIEDAYDMVSLPEGICADFALRCVGDSMSPLINDGDYVFIRKQPDVEEGQTAAVMIEGEATLKHVYHVKDGLTLVANNRKYAPINAVRTEVSIIGLAVGVFSSII